MESVNDTQYKQCAVKQFLVAKKHSRLNVHKHLCDVYERAVVNRSTTVHWTKRVMALKTGKPELQDLTCTGCPVTSVSREVPQHDYAIVYDDRHITT
jgi:hydroxyethylthiazole kinase-like sugar kinase family protein